MSKNYPQKQLELDFENWTTISGYPDYLISDHGRVKRIKNSGGRQGNCWKAGRIKILSSNGFYLKTFLYGPGGNKQFYIHRLVLLSFVGTPPDGYECNHKDCNRFNNRLDNLEWVTPQENVDHAVENGLIKAPEKNPMPGESHPMHKLKDGEVWLIKKILHESKTPQSKICKMFNVSQTAISKIKMGIRWKHIEYCSK